MKKYILLTILLIGFINNLFAQEMMRDHNGYLNATNDQASYFIITFNGIQISNANVDDYTFFIETDTEPLFGTYFKAFSMGNVDKDGNRTINDKCESSWNPSAEGLVLMARWDDFGKKIGPSTNSITVKIKNTVKNEEKTVVYSIKEWEFNATYTINLGIDPPDFGITVPPLSLCEGSTTDNTLTATVTAPPAAYHVEWLKDGVLFTGVTAGGANNSVATVNANCLAGVYTLTAKVIDDSDATNFATCEVVLTVLAKPNVTLTVDKSTICMGEAIVLTAGGLNALEGEANYVWSGGSGTGVINATTFPVDGANWTKNGNISGALKPNVNVADYKVVGTAGNGCSATSPLVSVTVNPKPVFTWVTNDRAICAGAIPVDLTIKSSTPGATFRWIVPAGKTIATVSVSPMATTEYKVLVDAAGCPSDTARQTITVNPLPVVKITPSKAVYCQGDEIQLTASTTATGTTTYNWTTKPVGATVAGAVIKHTPTAAGSFDFAVVGTTDKGCAAVAVTQSVTVNPVPVITSVTVPKLDVCLDDEITLTTVMAGTASDYTYAWTKGGTAVSTLQSPTVTINGTGLQTYTLTATHKTTGCKATKIAETTGHSVVINSITRNPGGKVTYNKSGTATPAIVYTPTLGGGTPPTYSWTPAGLFVDPTAEVATTKPLTGNTGQIQLEVTDPFGCTAVKTDPGFEIKPYTPMTIKFTGAQDYCAGTDIKITPAVTGGVTPRTYTWVTVPAGGPAIITSGLSGEIATIANGNLTEGSTYKFKLSVTDESTTKDSTVTITIRKQPTVKITVSNTDTCKGLTVALLATPTGANGTAKYAWTGGTTPTNLASVKGTVANNGPNVFKVTLTDDAIGCAATDQVTVNGHSISILSPQPNTAVLYGTAVTLDVPAFSCGWTGVHTGKYTYTWRPAPFVGSASVASMTSVILTDTPPAKFTVEVSGHGCKQSVDFPVKVVGKGASLVAKDDSVCFGVTAAVTATVTKGSLTTAEATPKRVLWSAVGDATGFTPAATLTGSKLNTAVLTAGQSYKYAIEADFLISGLTLTLKDTAEIFVRKLPVLNEIEATATVGGTAVTEICAGTSLTLTASGTWGDGTELTDGAKYTWSNGVTGTGLTKTLVPAATATYRVTLDDGKCSVFKDKTVTVNPKPEVKTVTQYACGTDIINLKADGVTTGSTAGLTYMYFTDAACAVVVADATKVANGTYYIVGTTAGTGCTDTTAVKAIVTPTPTLTVTNMAPVCKGIIVDLKTAIQDIPVPDLTYAYYSDVDGLITSLQNVNQSGTYYIKGTTRVTDVSEACPSVLYPVTVTVDSVKPTLAASVNGTPLANNGQVAPNTKVDFTAGPAGDYNYTFVKVSPRGVIPGNGNTASTIVTADAAYRVIVKDNVKTCTDSADMFIDVAGNPLDIVADPRKVAVCIGTTDFTAGDKKLIATASGGKKSYTYTWSDTAGLALTYTKTAIDGASEATITSIGTLAVGDHMILVKVRDANGSEDSVRVKLTINGLPVITIKGKETGGDTVCQNSGDLTLAAAGATGVGAKYNWISPALTIPAAQTQIVKTNVATPVTGTLYRVVGTDGNGCSDTASWNVLVHPVPTVTLASDGVVCAGATVTLTAKASDGTRPYGYTWTGATATTATDTAATAILAVGANVFKVDIKDANKCAATAGLTVTVNPLPVVTTTTQYVCGTETIDLTATGVASPAGLTYTYFTDAACAAGVADATKVANGTYYIVGKTTEGCTDTTAVKAIVTPAPTLTVTDMAPVCKGITVDLETAITTSSVPDLTYAYYSDVDGLITSLQNVNQSGTYYIEGTTKRVNDVSEACPSVLYPVTVTIDSVKPTLAASVNGTPLAVGEQIAPNTTVDFTAGPTGNHLYTFVQVAPRLVIQGESNVNTTSTTVTKSGTYRVIVTNTVMGCTDSAQIAISVSGEALSIAGAGDEEVCIGTTVFPVGERAKKLGAQASGGKSPYTYTWSDTAGLALNYTQTAIAGASEATITSIGTLAVGEHMILVKVKDASGSEASIRVKLVIKGLPMITIKGKETGGDTVCQNSGDLTLAAAGATGVGAKYDWISPALTIPAAQTQIVKTDVATPVTGTLYRVVGTDGYGCSDTASWNVLVHPVPTVTLASDGVVCAGATVTLTAKASDGTRPYTYTWGTGATATTATDTAATAVLAAGANVFTVDITDANGCAATMGSLTITGQSVNATLTAAATGVTTGTSISVSAGTSVTLSAVGSTGATVYEILQESPVKASIAGPGSAMMTGVAPIVTSTYKSVVSNAAGCRDTSELCTVTITGEELALTAFDDTICFGAASAVLKTTVTGGSGHPVYAWMALSDNTTVGIPSGQADQANLSFTTLAATTPVGKYGFQVKVTDGVSLTDTAYLVIREAGSVKLLLAGDTCTNAANVGIPLQITLAGASGNNMRVIYEYKQFITSEPWIRDSVLSLGVGKVIASFDNGEGNYRIVGVRDGNSPACLGSVTGTPTTFKIGKVPTVKIQEGSSATYRDSVFALNIQAPAGYDYSWSRKPVALPDEPVSGTKLVNQSMGNDDIEYIAEAANKNVAACKAYDTVTVYRIPDAPVVDIDTNTNSSNIKIHWNDVTKASGYRVMHRYWDGYATAGQYTEKLNLNARMLPLENADMDTVEFFYVTASRSIAELGMTYYSHSSDTVGYMVQFIRGEKSPEHMKGKGAIELLSYPFDMLSKGIVSAQDLCEKLLKSIDGKLPYSDGYIARFEQNTESWNSYNYLGEMEIWDGTNFNLAQGNVYQISLSTEISQIPVLMYGRLPDRFKYDFRVNVKTDKIPTSNFMLFPLSMFKQNKRQYLGDMISKDVPRRYEKVSIWSFKEQAYSAADWLEAFGSWVPEAVEDDVTVKIWTPVQLIMIDEVLNWKK